MVSSVALPHPLHDKSVALRLLPRSLRDLVTQIDRDGGLGWLRPARRQGHGPEPGDVTGMGLCIRPQPVCRKTQRLEHLVTRGAARTESDEFLSAETMALSDALDLIKKGEIKDSKTVVTLLYAAGFIAGR